MDLTFPSLVPNPLTGVLEVKSVPVQVGFPFARTAWYVGTGQQIETIEELFNVIQPNDVAFLAPQRFEETGLVLDKSGVSLIGYGFDLGGRGSAFIEPGGVNDPGLSIEADDVTLINVGVAGKGTAAYALQVADDIARFRAYRCKLEGPDGVAVRLVGTGDAMFDDCEFCWCGIGVDFVGGLTDFPTQTLIRRSRFHNIVTAHLRGTGGTGVNVNTELIDNFHDKAEDGTAPTDFLLLDAATSSGLVSGCRFATPTNDAALLTIAADIMWMANATEAGWSTARPA
jgi:hypothetical protein